MEQEEPEISLETLTPLAKDPNSTLFDDDKVDDDTANGMAIEEAKVEETTIVPPPALPEMEESLNEWLCTN